MRRVMLKPTLSEQRYQLSKELFYFPSPRLGPLRLPWSRTHRHLLAWAGHRSPEVPLGERPPGA